MKRVACLLLLAAGLAGQPPSAARRLNSTLLTLRDGAARASVGQQLATDIVQVADPDHRPSPAAARRLADDLTASLAGANPSVDRLSQVTTPIVDVLYSAGTSTIGFYETVDRAEKALLSLGVNAQAARRFAESLKAAGMQVRGPEGVPVR